jgi:uncharacterized repeat protein (TIGR02543 family)
MKTKMIGIYGFLAVLLAFAALGLALASCGGTTQPNLPYGGTGTGTSNNYGTSNNNTGTGGGGTGNNNPISYTITFNANNGSGTTPAAQTVNKGSSITLPSGSGLTRTGYTFGGWNTRTDGMGTNHAADFSYTVQYDTTLYAKWNVTVTFNSNGGSSVAAQTISSGGTATRPDDPARNGYTFDNWYSNAGLTTVYNFSTPVTGNIILYAKWVALQTVSPDSIEYYWIDQHDNLVTTSGGTTSVASGTTLTITAQSTGYVGRQWYLNGKDTGQSGNTYTFSSTTAGRHTVGLFVEKDGRLYNTNITITVQAAGSEANPFPLTASTWANGSITSTASTVWYSFNVTGGTTYYVWWNDSYEGNSTKTLDVKVSAYYSSGTSIFTSVDSGWSSYRSFTASSSGTVKIKVEPYSSGTGTFAVAYRTSSTRP